MCVCVCVCVCVCAYIRLLIIIEHMNILLQLILLWELKIS